MAEGKTIDDLKVGNRAQFSKRITEADIDSFGRATGDLNPVHFDEAYARETVFKGRIAHGILSLGLISAVFGNILPGPGTIYLSQEVRFLAPVRIGDTLTAQVEVLEVVPEKNRVKFKTVCINQNGQEVVTGVAWVMPPQEQEQKRLV